MPYLVLFVVTSVVFLVLDAVMLRQVIQPLFKARLGGQLIDGVRMVPAALFYVTYMTGILWFVGLPALRGEGGGAFLNGAMLGFVAYGTFELTSWAVMRNWHWSMVATDWAWGTLLTGLAAWAGVAAARALG